jgi:COP9 signalosome complex subunit 8
MITCYIAAEQYGWSYDTSTRILKLKVLAISTPQTNPGSKLSAAFLHVKTLRSYLAVSLKTFKFIADSVAELEA